ncbi:glutamate receptor ionotropic, kainate 2-like [Homarus americanus]|uniref:glutamate receptor ionotropic, kainate 2-like n=1 Tax=Homarus americanus TaxID=6706 RepID=UPI001C462A45|nr:glutamate receptor ionotropic, kainate 2-like [Homarus americanus]
MPFVFKRDDGSLDGTSKRLMDVLASWLNFTATYSNKASDLEWGKRDENGTWSGILGDVHRGRKHLAVNYLTVTDQRAQDFDYSVSYYNEGFGLALKVPPPLPRWRSLLYPYTSEAWAALVGVVLVVGFTFYLLNLSRSRFSLSKSLMMVMRGMVGQSVQRVPTWWVVRIFLGLWWFSAWVLDISYTSNLIAVLTVPTYPSRIHTIEQLANSGLRLCMLDYGEFVPEALATSSDVILARLGPKLDLVPIMSSLEYNGEEACVERVLAGTHVHTETFSYEQILYIEMGVGEEVYFLKEQLYVGSLAFFFRKNTPWKYKFDAGMRRLVEAGLVHKWYSDIMDEFRRGIRSLIPSLCNSKQALFTLAVQPNPKRPYLNLKDSHKPKSTQVNPIPGNLVSCSGSVSSPEVMLVSSAQTLHYPQVSKIDELQT